MKAKETVKEEKFGKSEKAEIGEIVILNIIKQK